MKLKQSEWTLCFLTIKTLGLLLLQHKRAYPNSGLP